MLLQGFYVKTSLFLLKWTSQSFLRQNKYYSLKNPTSFKFCFKLKPTSGYCIFLISAVKKYFFPQAFSNNNDSLALKEDYIFFQGELEVFFSRLHSAKENIYVPVRVYVQHFFFSTADFGDTQQSFNIHFQRSSCTYAVRAITADNVFRVHSQNDPDIIATITTYISNDIIYLQL